MQESRGAADMKATDLRSLLLSRKREGSATQLIRCVDMTHNLWGVSSVTKCQGQEAMRLQLLPELTSARPLCSHKYETPRALPI